MSLDAVAKPHDIAAAEINGWRGYCLDLFARAEAAIDLTLRNVCKHDSALSMKHLTGQRLADMVRLATGESTATERQRQALTTSLEAWQALYLKRNFLAHGVANVLLDRHGCWHVQLDFRAYRGGREIAERWTCNKTEALDFQTDLEKGFKSLSGQLGGFRTRLNAAHL